MNQDRLYPLWLEGDRAEARKNFAAADKTLSSLKERGNTYARAVEAMRDIRKKVLDVLEAAPDALPEARAALKEAPGGGQ